MAGRFLLILLLVLAYHARAQQIVNAEYFFDSDPGFGNATPLSVTAGEQLNEVFSISTNGLTTGFHSLNIRVQDENGKWSHFRSSTFYLGSTPQVTSASFDITAAEYFFDSDPGPGNGTSIAISQNDTVDYSGLIPATGLEGGMHTLYIRVKDGNDNWSHFSGRTFFLEKIAASSTSVTAAEYFFDSDPGVGNGVAMAITPDDTVTHTEVIPTSSLSEGFHTLSIRVKDDLGAWSHFIKRTFYLAKPQEPAGKITEAEYFIDADPGIGMGTPISVTTPADTVEMAVQIPTTGLDPGFHKLAVRVKNEQGRWSLYQERSFLVQKNTVSAPIVAAEYFIDSDPGHGNGISVPVTSADTVTSSFIASAASLSHGSHTISLRVMDASGKWSHFQSRTFEVCNISIQGDFEADTVCLGDTTSFTDLTVISDPTGVDWIWDVDGNGSDDYTNTGDFRHKYTAAGEYNVRLIVYAGSNCADTTYKTVVVQNASVFAGDDFNVCESDTSISVTGSLSGSASGTWSTEGTGGFFSSAYDNGVYLPSGDDKTAGYVDLVLTGNASACAANKDTVRVGFDRLPAVDAGPNQYMDATGVDLSGTVENAGGAFWMSSGTGTFSPKSDTVVTSYIPSAADLSKNSLKLTLVSKLSACPPATDYLVLTAGTVCNVSINSSFNDNVVAFEAVNTDNVTVGSYSWDFGNGDKASGKIQSVAYAEPGDYVVTLTYNTADSVCFATAYDTISISVTSIPTFTISGEIRPGGNLLDQGKITLFKFDGRNYDFLRANPVEPADNGFFSFSNLENGYYLIHALPDTTSAYFNDWIATYYGDMTEWEDALFIKINNADFTTAHINLKPFVPTNTTWNTGQDGVTGKIVFETGVTLKVASPSENPVENAVITLYSSDGDRLTSTYTDPFGNYSFDDLEAGSYIIDVEYAGTNIMDSVSITVDGDAATREQGDGELTKEDIALGIFSKDTPETKILVYPNPATESLTIDLNDLKMDVDRYSVYDLSGVKVLESFAAPSNGKIILNVGDLQEGLYILEIRNGQRKWQAKFTVK